MEAKDDRALNLPADFDEAMQRLVRVPPPSTGKKATAKRKKRATGKPDKNR